MGGKTGEGGEEKGKEKLFSSFWCQAMKHRKYFLEVTLTIKFYKF